MFDWSGKNGDESGKSQGILIPCVSGNPGLSRISYQKFIEIISIHNKL